MDKDVDPLSEATPLDDMSVSGAHPLTPGEEAASYLQPGEGSPASLPPAMESSAAESSWADEVQRSASAGAIASGAAASEGWTAAETPRETPGRSPSFFGRREAPDTAGGRIRVALDDDADTLASGRTGPRYRLPHLMGMLLAMVAYGAFVIPLWGEAYIDFGDGNYMYIASRIAEGGIVYRDILAPQPPMHLFTGAGIVKLHEALRESLPEAWRHDHPIYAFRLFSLLLHFATFLLVVRLAGRAWGRASAGVAAGAVYMALPLTIWWSLGYQSEPLEIFFLVAMMNFAIAGGRVGDLFTGVFGALAAMTNATAAPFLLVLIVYMAIVNWRRAVRIAVPSLLLAGAVTLVMEFYAEGKFLLTVVGDQVGTYPDEGLIAYATRKLTGQGTAIMFLEGPFIAAGILGLFRFLRTSPLQGEARGGLAWFSLATMGSFVYVTKGGTMDYIHSLAGPALAIMGGGLWMELGFRPPHSLPGAHRPLRRRLLESTFPRLVGFVLVLLMYYPAATLLTRLWNQQPPFELPDVDHAPRLEDGSPGSNVQQVAFWIEKYSQPGDTILAPPFYAVLTGRRIWGDYSELLIWNHKDKNDRREGNAQGAGYQKTLALALALRNAELPLVIIELDQTGRLPEVMVALNQSYRALLTEPYRTNNTRLGIFVPKDDAAAVDSGAGGPGLAESAPSASSGPRIPAPPRERAPEAPALLAEPLVDSAAPENVEGRPETVDAEAVALGERAAPAADDLPNAQSEPAPRLAPGLDDEPTTAPVTVDAPTPTTALPSPLTGETTPTLSIPAS